jgi:hypothetical protein
MKTRLFLAAALALSGCGSSGASVPDRFAGTWGADCSSPYVRFASGTIHVFPDGADYKLKSASADAAGNLTVTYDMPQGPARETYVVEGDTLRLDKATYNGTEAAWHKAPMQKCS